MTRPCPSLCLASSQDITARQARCSRPAGPRATPARKLATGETRQAAMPEGVPLRRECAQPNVGGAVHAPALFAHGEEVVSLTPAEVTR